MENFILLFLLAALLTLLLKRESIEGVHKRYFYVAIGLLFLLSIQSYLEGFFATDLDYLIGRLITSFLGYLLRPMVGCFLALALEPRALVRWILAIPLFLNLAVYQTCFYSDIAFSFNADYVFVRGPLGFFTVVLFLFYIAAVTYEIYLRRAKARKSDGVVLILVILGLVGAGVFDLLEPSGSNQRMNLAFPIAILFVYHILRGQDTVRDPLTGLYNRQSFYDDEKSVTQSLSAIASIDLNGLKRTNDTLGHSAGDAALQDVAAAILATQGKSSYAYRVGGDEFLILFTKTPKDEVLARADAFRKASGKRATRYPSASPSASPGKRLPPSSSAPTRPCTRKKARSTVPPRTIAAPKNESSPSREFLF